MRAQRGIYRLVHFLASSTPERLIRLPVTSNASHYVT
jgi:hypothetical protein